MLEDRYPALWHFFGGLPAPGLAGGLRVAERCAA